MAKTAKSPYSVHPAVAHMRAIADNLPKKTGKRLEEWIKLVEASGVVGVKARQEWLKVTHSLGRDTAMTIAEMAEGEEYDPEALVEALYEGPKAGLRPIYDKLLELGLALGPDSKACPCSTYVPLMRKRQFAMIKPTTRTRVDLGLALQGVGPHERLKPAKNLGSDRINVCVGLSSVDEIDAEVEGWLKAAYEQDAE